MQITNTNIDLYKTFVAVYETEKGVLAAERLGIVPTGVSSNLRSLETQLDAKLFNSFNKGFKPTRVAIAIYPYIKEALVAIHNGESILMNFTEIIEGHLHIGCHAYIANYVLLDYFTDFSEKHPGVTIKFTNKSKTSMDVMLECHDIDLIIDVVAKCKSTGKLTTQSLGYIENTFYTSTKYMENKNLSQTINKTELFENPVLLYSKKHNTMVALQKALDIPLANRFEITTSELMYGMVRKNYGIGYAITKFLDNCAYQKDIVRLTVKDTELPRSNLAVITNRKDKNPITQKFVEGLIEYCHKHLKIS